MAKGRSKSPQVGEDTMARIDKLKSGWSLPDNDPKARGKDAGKGSPKNRSFTEEMSEDEELPTVEMPPSRERGKASVPPPPPGAKRDSKAPPIKSPEPLPARPPLPKARNARESKAPPPPPGRGKAESKAPPLPPARPKPASKAPPMPPPAAAKPQVPRSTSQSSAPPRRRRAQRSSEFEVGDLQDVELPDSLPRRSGVLGDIAYLFRVIGRKRSARRELESVNRALNGEREARNTLLLEMARSVVGDERFDQTLVDRARTELLAIEERRSQFAGKAAAVEDRIALLKQKHEDSQKKRREEQKSVRQEIERLEAEITPLIQRASDARKRAAKLRLDLNEMDDKIRKKESSLLSIESAAAKKPVQVEIEAARSERERLAALQPAIAKEVAGVEPVLAKLTAEQDKANERVDKLKEELEREEKRLGEKIHAMEASKVVQSRGVEDESEKRQSALLELAEELQERDDVTSVPKMEALERLEGKIELLEKQRINIRELLGSVEKGPIVRAYIYLFLLVAIGAGAALVLTGMVEIPGLPLG